MSKYELITDLCESKAFRSKQAANKLSRNERQNLLYGSLLGVIAASLDTSTSSWAREYASRTAAFGNFDFFRPSGTDLYVLLHLAQQDGAIRTQKDSIVRALKSIGRRAANQSEIQQMMLRLERSLPGLNSRLRTARRAILAWDKTSPAARRSAVQNIIQVMESMNRRAEVLPYLRILKGGPRGKFGKTSTLKKAAALAGLGLAGFALGYASYDKRGGFGKRTGRGLRDSVELDTGNMLAEDRPTQLSYIVQKLPEHPAVEEIISVNYIADGISAFVRTTDGNAYEFEIRPARYAKGHEEKRMSSEELEEAWEYKVVEVEESDENT